MTAAQMLAAAGEPNTTAGRAKFHQRFPSKQAFDAWYTPKKEYGGGLTDRIAFPQQPDASSNRAPYYEKGGFFPPNVMPWNGPIGFYEQGGLTDEIAFPQQPTDHINFSAFPWQPQYAMGGLPMGANGEPCYECGGNYMQPGGVIGNKPAPNPDTYFNEQDAALDYPAQGTNTQYDYSKVTNQGPAFSQYSTAELNNMGANIPVPNPAQDARFAKIAEYNKEHPYIPAGGNLFKKSDNSPGRFQYNSGKYMPFPAVTNQPLVNNRYGGYMQTGGTTEMDQRAYTDNMANQTKQIIQNFTNSAQPAQQPYEVPQAGVEAAYGYEVMNNQNSDFNTVDPAVLSRNFAMEDRRDQLQGKANTSFWDLMNTPGNLRANTYLKNPTYKTKTVGSGMVNTNQQGYAKYGGLNKYQPGGTSIPGYTDEEVAASDDWFAKQVAESAANEAKNNYYKQISGNTAGSNSGANQGTTNTNTNVGNTNDNVMGDTKMTADELAYFRGMMRGSNQGNYAPSWQTQQNQGNAANWQAMANDPAFKNLLQNIQHAKYKNSYGIFGPRSKGEITFRTYYDPSQGKNVSVPVEQSGISSQRGANQQMQKGPKGPGIMQKLLDKNKQRKAGKNISKEQKLRMIADQEKMMMPTPDTYQGELAKSQQMPLTGEQRKKQFFDAQLAQDLNNPNYGNRMPAQSSSIPFNPGYQPAPQIGFAYGGAPQNNFNGYPEYAYGGEREMDQAEIDNFLAMGGTLEYLD